MAGAYAELPPKVRGPAPTVILGVLTTGFLHP
jgi:hypothetical protein